MRPCLWLPFGIGAFAVLAAATAAVCTAGDCGPAAWEMRVLDWFAGQRQPAADAMFVALTWLGSLWLLLPLAGFAVVLLWRRGGRERAMRFAISFGGAVGLAYLVKLLVSRPRPQAENLLIAVPADASFPSGHAMQITAFALAAVWAFAPHGQRAGWLGAALVLIALVGVSRLYLQVHFPTDVLAGTAAAALWALGFARAERAAHA